MYLEELNKHYPHIFGMKITQGKCGVRFQKVDQEGEANQIGR